MSYHFVFFVSLCVYQFAVIVVIVTVTGTQTDTHNNVHTHTCFGEFTYFRVLRNFNY